MLHIHAAEAVTLRNERLMMTEMHPESRPEDPEMGEIDPTTLAALDQFAAKHHEGVKMWKDTNREIDELPDEPPQVSE